MAKTIATGSALALCCALLLTAGTAPADASTSPPHPVVSTIVGEQPAIPVISGDAARTSAATTAVVSGVAVTRISGSDRYATAIAIAQRGFPSGASTVFVSTGTNYPDALSAAPAAISRNAPLLLTRPDRLSDDVKAEIKRLAPRDIIIVGGTGSVLPSVETALRSMAPRVTRVAGADRYATSASIAEFAFGTSGSRTTYVATGANFPDALSAGSAAGSVDGPVILVNGAAPRVPSATVSLISKLGSQTVKIAGGAATVSEGIRSSLTTTDVSTMRLSGRDRFATSVAVNEDAFTGSATAYLANGFAFPDALAGSVVAALTGSPLFIVPSTCVPPAVLDQLTRLGVTQVVLLGGSSALGTGVAGLMSCTVPAPAPVVTVPAPAPAPALETAPPGWTTLFRDDFSAAANTGLSSNWVYELGRWGTGAVDTTTNSLANVRHDGNGHLAITAIRDSKGQWTSGRVVTKRKDFAAPDGGQLMITASIKQPNPERATGYWPAFWALGADEFGGVDDWPALGEIDIMESVNGLSQVAQTLHCGTVDGGPCNEPYGLTSDLMACDGCLTDYHSYSAVVDRTIQGAEQLRFLVDGRVRFTVDQAKVGPAVWARAIDHGFLLILNLSIGGGYPNGVCGCDSVAAAPTSGGTMSVDYVAVYRKAATG